MKKILLIEDRGTRQKEFEEKSKIFLNSYSNIVDNMIGDRYTTLLSQIKDGSFDFEKYDVIMSHESAFGSDNAKVLSILESCQKPLVYFSGGISTTYYSNIEHEYAGLNSRKFYSQNLKLFLDEYSKGNLNLLLLCYGSNWKLYIILETLEKTNLFINNNIDEVEVRYKKLSSEVDFILLDSLDFSYRKPNKNEKLIKLEEIKQISRSIKEYILEVATHG
jgi:hypothetical protein